MLVILLNIVCIFENPGDSGDSRVNEVLCFALSQKDDSRSGDLAVDADPGLVQEGQIIPLIRFGGKMRIALILLPVLLAGKFDGLGVEVADRGSFADLGGPVLQPRLRPF